MFFDDFKVAHTKSPIVQQDDYYPFGLTFNSYQRENSTKNRYLYNQGTGEKKFLTERVFDLGLNIDLTKYRVYDPALGRWWQVDPLADAGDLVSLTPYNYSFNNPIRYSDPEGDCPLCPAIPIIIEVITAIAEGGAVAAGGTTVAVGLTALAKNAPEGAPLAGSYSPAVGSAMISKPGELSSPYFLNSKKSDGPAGTNNQGSGQGRGKNNRQHDPEATGDHTVVNEKGATTFKRNDRNPSGWDKESNIDKKGRSHVNKKTGESVPTPHRQGKDVDGKEIPGGVAPLAPSEMPVYKGVDEKWFLPSNF